MKSRTGYVTALWLLLMLALTGCSAWPLVPAGPMPEALAALPSDAQVMVTTEPWLVFRPTGQAPAVGLVFYPGNRVDPRSYAPPARAIAAQGYVVVIVPMPQDLAVLAPDSAAAVIAAIPTVGRWAVGGHSMGGAMAAGFAYRNPTLAQGLVLWASYPGPTDDLSGVSLAVVSIYGTRDGWSTPAKIDASRALLPPTTRFVAIKGGNHAQFGWYGEQPGDGVATISREMQQAQVVTATLNLLAALEGKTTVKEARMAPGPVVLFGSGETSASGRRAFDWLFRRVPPPIRVAVLETPAGFQPNSAWVAGQVADFLRQRLQNYKPEVTVAPARKRGTPFSPDDPDMVAPLLRANILFAGPGSPTYAVRQLQDSRAWHTLVARHHLGAAVVLASAMTLAASQHTLPVYEIYKAGADLHWQPGLDFCGPYGLSLVFVPHWNNTEGGANLDTSRCFMGQERFAELLALLPADLTVVGIDEHTALVMDLGAGNCHVVGRGGVTILRGDEQQRLTSGETCVIAELGSFRVPEPGTGVPSEVWDRVQAACVEAQVSASPEPPPDVLALVGEREAARARRDWSTADALRDRIAARGWEVRDTGAGPELIPAVGRPLSAVGKTGR